MKIINQVNLIEVYWFSTHINIFHNPISKYTRRKRGQIAGFGIAVHTSLKNAALGLDRTPYTFSQYIEYISLP